MQTPVKAELDNAMLKELAEDGPMERRVVRVAQSVCRACNTSRAK